MGVLRYATKYIGGPIGRFMRARGWAGVTLPVPFYGALVLMWEPDSTIIELRHEILGHVPQVARLGTVRYVATILWQYARYGHHSAPMEIEARRLADAAHQEGL